MVDGLYEVFPQVPVNAEQSSQVRMITVSDRLFLRVGRRFHLLLNMASEKFVRLSDSMPSLKCTIDVLISESTPEVHGRGVAVDITCFWRLTINQP